MLGAAISVVTPDLFLCHNCGERFKNQHKCKKGDQAMSCPRSISECHARGLFPNCDALGACVIRKELIATGQLMPEVRPVPSGAQRLFDTETVFLNTRQLSPILKWSTGSLCDLVKKFPYGVWKKEKGEYLFAQTVMDAFARFADALEANMKKYRPRFKSRKNYLNRWILDFMQTPEYRELEPLYKTTPPKKPDFVEPPVIPAPIKPQGSLTEFCVDFIKNGNYYSVSLLGSGHILVCQWSESREIIMSSKDIDLGTL